MKRVELVKGTLEQASSMTRKIHRARIFQTAYHTQGSERKFSLELIRETTLSSFFKVLKTSR